MPWQRGANRGLRADLQRPGKVSRKTRHACKRFRVNPSVGLLCRTYQHSIRIPRIRPLSRRVLAVDMLLGNADRLVCEPLGWRGNAGNVLRAQRGRWKGRIVAIDALVQRRPPNGLVSAEVGGLVCVLASSCVTVA